MYALILAGGKGERLRPFTDDRPKPMVPVNGMPILEHQIRWLNSYGVDHFVLLCGYLHHVIQEYFGDGSRWGVAIEYCVEETPLGRGGAFKQGFTRIPKSEPFVIGTNGDNLNTQDLRPFLEAHQGTGALVTVMLTQLRSPYGIAQIEEDHRISGFQEKPLLPYWLNAGVYAISAACFNRFPDQGDHEDTTFPALAEEGKLYAFRSTAYWRAVDTVKDLTEATREFAGIGGQ
ncbi:MAG: nucleotidyltransferase family protein [Chloroflexi bacterium]|nr:nucleotidyltransferase family protein [Chloroflexota bacterium]